MRVLLKTIDQPNLTKSEQYLQRLAFFRAFAIERQYLEMIGQKEITEEQKSEQEAHEEILRKARENEEKRRKQQVEENIHRTLAQMQILKRNRGMNYTKKD